MTQGLTIAQLRNICANNKYILLRDKYLFQYGFNCKSFEMSVSEHSLQDSHISGFISYKPCSFQEYITHKTPFITP